MAKTVRFGVSLDDGLLQPFDKRISEQGYANRSEAIRDLIRNSLVAHEWGDDEEVIGTITLVYDHHVRELTDRLTNIQHEYSQEIVSTLHVHLDHNNCLEVLVVRADSHRARSLADALRALRGVKHTTLGMTTCGKSLA